MNLAHKTATHVTISRTTLPRDTLPRDAALDAYTYEDLAFDAVLEELVPVADPALRRCFQLIFIWQNAPKINSHTGTISAERMLFDTQTENYDLPVWARMEDGVHITLECNRDLFREETITGMTCSPLR